MEPSSLRQTNLNETVKNLIPHSVALLLVRRAADFPLNVSPACEQSLGFQLPPTALEPAGDDARFSLSSFISFTSAGSDNYGITGVIIWQILIQTLCAVLLQQDLPEEPPFPPSHAQRLWCLVALLQLFHIY